ncbi:MAG: hypothetical protein ABH817_02410 [archaeon]
MGSKTVKDYLLKGGVAGRKFRLSDEFYYEIKTFCGGASTEIDTLRTSMNDPTISFRNNINLGSHLDDPEIILED